MTDGIPEIIEVWLIAQAVGWSVRKTTRFLKAEQLVSKMGSGGAYVMREAFSVTLPTVYRVFVSKYKAGELSSGRGRHMVKHNKNAIQG